MSRAERITNYLATVLGGTRFELPLGRYTTFHGSAGYRIVPSQAGDKVRFSNVYIGKSGKVIYKFKLFSTRPPMNFAAFKHKTAYSKVSDGEATAPAKCEIDVVRGQAEHIELSAVDLFSIPAFCSYLGNVKDYSQAMAIQSAIGLSDINYADFISRARLLARDESAVFSVKESDDGVIIFDNDEIEGWSASPSKVEPVIVIKPKVETSIKTNSNWGLFS